MKSFLVVSPRYPTQKEPNQAIFVQSLVNEFRRQNLQVPLIAPQRFFSSEPLQKSSKNFFPSYASFSNKKIGRFSSYLLSCLSFALATQRTLPRIKISPEAVYGHFLYPSGWTVSKISRKLNIPSFVALGESSFEMYQTHVKEEEIKKLLNSMCGILCLSERNQEICRKYSVPERRLKFLPNAADNTKFFPRNKLEARDKLELPKDQFILIFVGHFNHNKGSLRVMKALEGLSELKIIFLGSGPDKPQGEQILFCDKVLHENIPNWMSAADAFILPSINEGSPNVVAEAMACGLPIISSNLPIIRTMCGENAALMIDPLNTNDIRSAIQTLVQSPKLREKMSTASLKKATSFSLETRAQKIVAWMDQLSSDWYQNIAYIKGDTSSD